MRYWAPLGAGAVVLAIFLWWLVREPAVQSGLGVDGESGIQALSGSIATVEKVPRAGPSVVDLPDSVSNAGGEAGGTVAFEDTSLSLETSGESDWLTAGELARPDVKEIFSVWRGSGTEGSKKFFQLLDALGDSDLAARILGQLVEESPKKVREVLPSQLAAVNPDLAVRVAEEMLFSEHEDMRRDAAETLGEWGSLGHVYLLREALERSALISPRESVALAQALDELSSTTELHDQRVARLEAFESGTDREKYGAAAQAVHDDDLPICFMAANDPSSMVQGAGMRCLMVIGRSQQAVDTVAGWEGVNENVVRGMQRRVDQGWRSQEP